MILLFAFFVSLASAQVDVGTLEGKWIRKPNPDDVKLLGVYARGLLNEAAKGRPFSPETGKAAALAAKAYAGQNLDDAYRYVTRFVLLAEGARLSEATEVATSLDFRIERRIYQPGETINVSIDPLFTLDRPLSGAYIARLSPRTLKGETAAPAVDVKIGELAARRAAVPAAKLKPGRYALRYELFSPDGKSLVEASREFIVDPKIDERLAALRKKMEKIGGTQCTAALETVEYTAGILSRARKEYAGTMLRSLHPMTERIRKTSNLTGGEPFDITKDLGAAEQMASALLAGRNPLESVTGDLRLAYRSKVDNTLQPFRVFVPKGFDPRRRYPLIVALHGASGDENTYMDRYVVRKTGVNVFQSLAQDHGYFLATPNGRGAFGMYEGAAERDVLDVLERVLDTFPIESRAVFLTGHSMGAMGTWTLGFKHAEKFAALAPVAGRPVALDSVQFQHAPEMPVLYSQGAKDMLATAESARQMVALAQKRLKNFQYVEYPNDDHFVIGVTSMPSIFEFFDRHRSSK